MVKLTERATVRMNPVDYALVCELGRQESMDTPTLLRTRSVKAARAELPADVIERIERRYGGNNG